MPNDSSDDFDLSSLFTGPANIMAGVLGIADNARKTLNGVVQTAQSLQRTAKSLESIVARLDSMVTEIEAPIRVLAPELEKATARLVRVSEAFEGPVDRLLPGLEGAIASLERVSITSLPETLEAAQRQLLNVLEIVRDLPKGFTSGLTGVTELMSSTLGLGRRAAVSGKPKPAATQRVATPQTTRTQTARNSTGTVKKRAAASPNATKKSSTGNTSRRKPSK